MSKVIRSIAWNVLGSVGSHLLDFLAAMIIARTMQKSEIGTLQVFLIVWSFARLGAGFGFPTLVVRDRRRNKDIAGAYAGAALLLTGAMAVLLWFVSAPLAASLGAPELQGMFRVAAFVLPVVALAGIVRGSLESEMQFGRINAIDLVQETAVLGGVCALLALSPTAGVVFGAYLAAAVGGAVAMMWHGARLGLLAPPVLRPRGVPWLQSVTLAANQLVNNLTLVAVVSVLGVMLGKKEIAVFSYVRMLSLVPVMLLTTSVRKVVYSATVHMNSEQRLQASRKLVSVLALVIFGVLIWAGFFIEALVELLLGGTWSEAAPLIRWLMPMAALQLVTAPNSFIFTIHGRPYMQLAFNAALLGTCTTASWFGARNGLADAVLWFGACGALAWGAYHVLVLKEHGDSLRNGAWNLGRFLPIWAAAFVVCWAIRGWSCGLAGAGVAAGLLIGIHIGILHFGYRNIWRELIGYARTLWLRASPEVPNPAD